MAEFDCEHRDNCICPYCGNEDDNSWELRGDDGEASCPSCGRSYGYVRNVTVTYSTSAKEQPK